MNIIIWIIQGLLAAMFLMTGTMKSMMPMGKLKEKFPLADDFSPAMVRFIGLTQLLAAAGLILPQLTGIAVILTPVAATGLALTMVFASVYHIRKKDKSIAINVIIFLLSVTVAYYRF